MKYQVNMNGEYMNVFDDYVKACELRDRLQRHFKNARVEVIIYE